MTSDTETNPPSAQEIQISLARARTLLAQDRTLLAWIRTSLTLIGFGFTLAKFVHSLIQTGSLHLADSKYPEQLGIILMVLGILGLFAGAFDYWRAVKRLRTVIDMPYWSASLVISLVVAIVSISVMINLILNLDP